MNQAHNIYIYLIVMALVSFAIRVTPITLLRKQIKSRFLRSFLYYVPYVTLALMTVPAMITATRSPISGAAALIVGIIASWLGSGLFPVAVLCCLTVFLTELLFL